MKASNPKPSARFGASVAFSKEGTTLAVGATGESSAAKGVDGDPLDVSAPDSGAVYVFTRILQAWSQQAYLKAPNTESSDFFGRSVALSEEGSLIAVGASGEDSGATGINGDSANNAALSSGAVFLFSYADGRWSPSAYVKPSNTTASISFGEALTVSNNHLVVGGFGERSNASGINGDQTNTSLTSSGAVYDFVF